MAARKHSESGARMRPAITSCPAAALGEQAEAVAIAAKVVDESATTLGPLDPHVKAFRLFDSMTATLADHASYVKATSSQGAAYQVMCAIGHMGLMRENPMSEHEKKSRIEAVERLLYSALGVMVANDPVYPTACSYWADESSNPLRHLARLGSAADAG